MNIDRVVEAIRTIDRLHNLGDAIYEVREREAKGWDGPNVSAYNAAHKVLRDEGVLTLIQREAKG